MAGTDSEADDLELSEKRIAALIVQEGPMPVRKAASILGISTEETMQRLIKGAKRLKLSPQGMVTLAHALTGPFSELPIKKHRRPATKRELSSEGQGDVCYMCVADEFNLEELSKFYYKRKFSTVLEYDVLHVSAQCDPTSDNEHEGGAYGSSAVAHALVTAEPVAATWSRFDLFIFKYGVVVWWGFEKRHFSIVESEFSTPASKIAKWITTPYTAKLVTENFPVWCKFSVDFRDPLLDSTNPTSIGEPDEVFTEKLQRDHFLIPHNSPNVKLCISHALAQSAKIDYLELKIADLTAECKPLPREMMDRGTVTVSEHKLLKLRGEVLFFRLMLKAGSDLLDEPELFWENPWLKPYYRSTRDYFEINERVSTLDSKLDANNQILEMLADHFQQRHGSRLEWIVICLVAVEVIIGILELVMDAKPWMK